MFFVSTQTWSRHVLLYVVLKFSNCQSFVFSTRGMHDIITTDSAAKLQNFLPLVHTDNSICFGDEEIWLSNYSQSLSRIKQGLDKRQRDPIL
jgi:hypothetical protein